MVAVSPGFSSLILPIPTNGALYFRENPSLFEVASNPMTASAGDKKRLL